MADMLFQRLWNDKEGVIRIANEMLDKCYVEESDEIQDKIDELNRKLEVWEKRYDNLVNMRMNGEIDKPRYDSKREEIETERESIMLQLEELQTDNDMSNDEREDKLEILKYGLEQNFDFSSKHIPEEIIDLFVNEIVVCTDGFIWKLNLPWGNDFNLEITGKKDKFETKR